MSGYLESNIYALFEARARKSPDSVAVVSAQGDATYAEIQSLADRVAGSLVKRQVAAEEPVGVLMKRSPAMIATLLGVLKAGAAYVPLDPDDPPARNSRITGVSGCRLMIGDSRLLDAIDPTGDGGEGRGSDLECVDVEQILTNASPVREVATAPGGQRLAYIIFTSGSTGEPKGVEVEHRSVVNLLRAARELIGFTGADRFLAASTIGFDISVTEIFLPLTTGGSILLRDREILTKPRDLARDIERHGVTVFQTGPSVWSLILSEVPELPRLRVAITTAEAIDAELARKVAAQGEQAWNLYGPTEATVWATARRLSEEPPGPEAIGGTPSPIGAPIGGAQAFVVDKDDQVVTTKGVRGELCIGGPGVARSYRLDETLTKERFAILGEPPTRCYRTGDIASWGDDGELRYFGRADEQLKIRGVRIEPAEVESALREHPDVRDAAATWYSSSSGRSLVVGVVMCGSLPLVPAELHGWLSARLPAPMLPSRFLQYERLPLTPSGKVDRNELRRACGRPHAGVAVQGPRLSDTERSLADIWESHFGVESATADSHFFAEGGDSLAAVNMMLEVEARFGITMPVRSVYREPTLAGLARLIERLKEDPEDDVGSPFVFPLTETSAATPTFFCNVDLTMAQRGKWRIPGQLFAIAPWAQGVGFSDAEDLVELARRHVVEIQRIWPRGPYRIAGFSFGGLLALETARQLRLRGQRVELLFLLDPMAPSPNGVRREPPAARAQRHAVAIRGGHARDALTYLRKRIQSRLTQNPLRGWLTYQLLHLAGRSSDPVAAALLPKDRWPAFWYNARRFARTYVGEPYDGPVLAVFGLRNERYEAWADLLGAEGDLRVTGASHLGYYDDPCLEEWMTMFAERLGERLR